MTQEDKELLLKDLGARLQYKPHCRVFKLNEDIKENDDILYGIIGDNVITLKSDKDECLMYYQIKPYLRPMSSMTEEEKIEWCTRAYAPDEMKTIKEKLYVIQYNAEYANDFYNEHHFDYRGLIERGLALEAPEGMY